MTDWLARARFVASAVSLLAAAFVLAKTGRDALFVQDRGLFDLPKAYIGIALLSGPLAFLTLWLLKACGPTLARVLLPSAAALALVLFSLVVQPGGGLLMTFFFMFVPLIWGVIFSVWWLLASDLLHGASRTQTARGYSLVGGAGIVGGIVGAGLARVAAPLVEPHVYLWFAALGLVVAACVMAAAERRYPSPHADVLGGPAARVGRMDGAIRALLANGYTRALVAAGMAAALSGVLIEFRFYVAAAVAEGAVREKAAFFANFYLVLNLLALAVQVLILPRLVHRIGVGGALLILPVALVGGTVGLAVSASLLVSSALRVAEGGLKSSIHRTSWEQAFLAVAGRERARAKVLVDGLAVRVAEGFGGGVLLLWLWFVVGDAGVTAGSIAWITALLAASVLVWLAVTLRLMAEIGQRASASASPIQFDMLPGPLPDT
jgi:AAA family ATP:ADP antiporter